MPAHYWKAECPECGSDDATVAATNADAGDRYSPGDRATGTCPNCGTVDALRVIEKDGYH